MRLQPAPRTAHLLPTCLVSTGLFVLYDTGSCCIVLTVLELCRAGWLKLRDPSASMLRGLGLSECQLAPVFLTSPVLNHLGNQRQEWMPSQAPSCTCTDRAPGQPELQRDPVSHRKADEKQERTYTRCFPAQPAHQKLDFLHVESVGTAQVVSQAPRSGNNHVWLPRQLQCLRHHVCGGGRGETWWEG